MQDLTPTLLELIRLAATDLPADVESALKDAAAREETDSPAQSILQAILKNITIARETSVPICQDTGTPIFYVKYPGNYSTIELGKMIRAAVATATKKNFLRPNAVDSLKRGEQRR